MLTGFAENGVIVITAADNLREYKVKTDDLADRGLETYSPSVGELTSDPMYHGMVIPPFIVQAGDFDDPLNIISREEAVEQQHIMVFDEDDEHAELNEMFALYEVNKTRPTHASGATGSFVVSPASIIAEEWEEADADIAQISDFPQPSEFYFVSYALQGMGTVVVITSRRFYEGVERRLYSQCLPDHHRIEPLIAGIIPPSLEMEILPGCFLHAGSPLAAKHEMLAAGFTYDSGFVRNVISGSSTVSTGNSPEEISEELGLSLPVHPDEFVMGLQAHGDGHSTFVMIVPAVHLARYGDRPYDVFLDPMIEEFLPLGYGEIAPGVFEVFRGVEKVRAELVALGMVYDEQLTDMLHEVLFGEVVPRRNVEAPIVPEQVASHQWDALAENYDAFDENERIALRKTFVPQEFLFYSFEDYETSKTVIVTVPKAYFEKHEGLFPHDLGLEAMMPPGMSHVTQNIFVMSGLETAHATIWMVKQGFEESMTFMMWGNLALYDLGLLSDLGLTR